ncbi:MAG: metalloprotease TldD [Rhodospirillaceae bacterium]|nr:metalloprotease TldD [Rhodospirillaceae bacterium]
MCLLTDLNRVDELFFERNGLNLRRVETLVDEAFHGLDDGELFFEYRQSESLTFDDRRLRNAAFNTSQGFGLRAMMEERVAYAHSSEMSETAIARAGATVAKVRTGSSGTCASQSASSNHSLYLETNPLEEVSFGDKVKLLSDIDVYARSLDPRVVQVTANLSGEWQAVQIIRAGGIRIPDIRPLVRINISVVISDGNRMEAGGHGVGGRVSYIDFIQPESWQNQTREALRQALVNLESIEAPAGEMDVVLGPGWPGILLHEAIGHGLEGDFNRKKTSAFSNLLGERVASEGVTVIDEGNIAGRRGSLNVDDEGTPTGRAVLIEDGILKGYMQDRHNARLMGVKPTGNGRRESFASAPLPRMTNTYMLSGNCEADEIISSVKKGLYAVNFGGGQVDITSGKFVFSASEAYLIENGKIGAPVKGATLIGNGPDVLTRVSMIGNDLKLDTGIGTCGKDGQGVPVGVGQPTLLVNDLTVGGTAT